MGRKSSTVCGGPYLQHAMGRKSSMVCGGPYLQHAMGRKSSAVCGGPQTGTPSAATPNELHCLPGSKPVTFAQTSPLRSQFVYSLGAIFSLGVCLFARSLFIRSEFVYSSEIIYSLGLCLVARTLPVQELASLDKPRVHPSLRALAWMHPSATDENYIQ